MIYPIMTGSDSEHHASQTRLAKSRTFIQGLDEITEGGLPKGRCTLVSGGPGTGKTLLAMEFLVRGALELGEPGLFMAFEELPEELAANVASLGFGVEDLVAAKKLAIDHIRVERNEIEETGEYDLEGLFVRLGYLIDSIGAKRVVVDTIEVLFGAFTNQSILRAEIRRLLHWLKERGVTAIVTSELGPGRISRHGLEEYVSDCVIFLDHRVTEQVSTRRLHIVKYRGSRHGTNEFPFVIGENGISVLPVTSLEMDHAVATERVSTGIPDLDALLGGEGYYRGSSVLVSGMPGTGKTSLAAHFAQAACQRGEGCLFFAFEESQSQIIRNMRSIGLDLEPFVAQGLLRFQTVRPTSYGLEAHLVAMHQATGDFDPKVVVIDPIPDLFTIAPPVEIRAMLIRLVDFYKSKGITAVFTNLISDRTSQVEEIGISSIADTWLVLRYAEEGGNRKRTIYALKSRGMAHSDRVFELRLTDEGVRLEKV